MPLAKLKEFLDKAGIKYTCISHSPAFTAREIAESVHVGSNQVAKTVMIKVDGSMVMAVLPGHLHIDLDRMKRNLRAKIVSISSEREFRDMFGDCEVGAMPPFGNLFGIPVFVDESLALDESIFFNAGTHREIIQMSYEDFIRQVKPSVMSFAEPVAA